MLVIALPVRAGCMGMSTAYKDKSSPVTDEESIAAIHKALELGVTFLDTSDMYGPFTNEELVGMVHIHSTDQAVQPGCLDYSLATAIILTN